MLQEASISAIHDDDLKEFLGGLDLLDDFEKGILKCVLCDIVVDYRNLHAVYPDSGQISLACDSPLCVRKLNSLMNKQ